MSSLQSIASFLLQFRREGRAAFLDMHRHPFLVGRAPESEASPSEAQRSFGTDTYRFDREVVGSWSDEELEAANRAEGMFVVEVAKTAANPWSGRIWLGRAGNNDLVIPHAGVSKLHAHFTIDPSGTVRVADAGSYNGTVVNGVAVPVGESVVIAAGDQLAFGEVQAVFHTPESLCEFLASLFD
jgi:hypothetical protein